MDDPQHRPLNPEDLSGAIVEALKRARAGLLERMAREGLTLQAGWRINEELRHTVRGTEWILSPIHLRQMPPALEARVCIDAEGRLLPEGAS